MSDIMGPPTTAHDRLQDIRRRIGVGEQQPQQRGGSSLEDRIAGAIGGALGPGGESDEPDIIGGYWEGPRDDRPVFHTFGGSDMRGPAEPYYQGDERALLRAMPTEQRARLQEVLVATGLTSSVIPGEMDPGTISGFERVLEMANVEGATWNQVVNRLRSRVQRGQVGDEVPGVEEGEEERDPFRYVDREYLPPDPAEVRQSVRNLASQIVPDADLSDEEVEYLTREFQRFGQQQFAAEQDNDRFGAEAQYRAGRPAEPGEEEIVELASGVAPVNAAARFREFFEQRYKDTIERGEDQEEMAQNRSFLDSSIGTALRPITGGR